MAGAQASPIIFVVLPRAVLDALTVSGRRAWASFLIFIILCPRAFGEALQWAADTRGFHLIYLF